MRIIHRLVPNMPVMHAVRAGFLIAATAFFFAGLHYLSIADTLSIFFVQPLIVTLLSPAVLGETVGLRRWIAVVIGFLGTLDSVLFKTVDGGTNWVPVTNLPTGDAPAADPPVQCPF